jgi:hypothetical protein
MPSPGPEEMAKAVLWTGVSTFSAKGKTNSETCHAHHWTEGDGSGGSGHSPSLLQVIQEPIMPTHG